MTSRNGVVVMALALVFGLPFAVAGLLVAWPELLPAHRANFGHFIEPPVATPVKGAWTLLVPKGDCDAGCRRAQTTVQVVRRALGAEARHVSGPADCRAAEWTTACATVQAAVGGDAVLVIVDPMGNAMMRYSDDVAPRELLKDVQRLLKVSRNWRYDGHQ